MERHSRRLTLRVSILEVVDGTAPLTDNAARRFTRPFSPECGWNATVRRATGPNPRGDFELSLVHQTLSQEHSPASEQEIAIKAFCRDFYTLDGPLSPRRVNPNPNHVFLPATDANSPTDAMYVWFFLQHSAGNTGGGLKFKNILLNSSSSGMGQAMSAAGSSIASVLPAMHLTQSQGGPANHEAVAAEVLKMVGESNKSQQVSESNERHTRAKQLILATIKLSTALTELESGTQSSTADLQSLKQHLDDFMDAVDDITKQHGDAAKQGEFDSIISKAGGAITTGFLAVTVTDWMGGFEVVNYGLFKSDAAAILDGQKTAHRWLCMILMNALRSNYRSRPDAPLFARLVTDMAAALDPQALEGWDSRFSSQDQLSRELRSFMHSWEQLLNQPPAAPQEG
ncbi:hypothetical protein B0I37DRAFT_440675 [Chaetomium sp. MPI-CAGE-AT-0009]|nr:hypothetical protein B0I37DRAFT_440675 [Chaetomium sp. MPI-CAGE-AT-0009]